MREKKLGLWFFGLAGTGKSFASEYVASEIEKPFILDGDQVRKTVSFDLGYDLPSRGIQIKRVFGLCQLVINNGYFPVASTVYMNNEVKDLCEKENIKLIEIERSFAELERIRPLYKSDKNVIGKDINIKELDVKKIYNPGTLEFKSAINELLRDLNE